jgi:hypothetical protein
MWTYDLPAPEIPMMTTACPAPILESPNSRTIQCNCSPQVTASAQSTFKSHQTKWIPSLWSLQLPQLHSTSWGKIDKPTGRKSCAYQSCAGIWVHAWYQRTYPTGIKIVIPVRYWYLVGITRLENLCIHRPLIGSIPSSYQIDTKAISLGKKVLGWYPSGIKKKWYQSNPGLNHC